MKIYSYDKKNGRFLASSVAKANPLEDGKFLIPAHATALKPLEGKSGTLVCFNGSKWEYIVDNRNENYWLKADASKVVFSLGRLIDDTMTEIEPIQSFPIWDTDKWAENNERLLARAVSKFAVRTDEYIQMEVERYNKSNGVLFGNIHNCSTYVTVDTYPHQAFCIAIVRWNAKVWETVRVFQKDTDTIPTDAEFRTVLDGIPPPQLD